MAVTAANASPVLVDLAQSRVEIAVKATLGSFAAQLGEFDMSVTVAAETGQVTAATFRFNFASINKGNATRDRDMNAWQQSDRFSTVVFTLNALDPAPGAMFVARGQLSFHGVERSISFPLSIETNQKSIIMNGEVPIDIRDYGLPVIREYLVLKVDPIVRLHFHLQGSWAGS